MTGMTRRGFVAAGTAGAAFGMAPAIVRAQDYPTKQVRVVVPYPAGGGTDLVARLIVPRLADRWKQTVIIDNKAGASGLIGTKAAAQSPADGYTIAYLHSGLVTVQAMNPRLDLLKEFRPVARL